MTPAEHYAEAESFLDLAEGLSGESKSRSEGRSYELAVLRAQVHATLATVDPEQLAQDYGQALVDEHYCTCPRLGASPIARTSTDPACPTHGGST